MAKNKSLSLLSWLLWSPMKFAFISFILFFLFIFITSILYPSASNTFITSLVLLAIIGSAFITLYKMPQENMDRHSFVALNNAQLFIVSTACLIFFSHIKANKTIIISQLMLLNVHFNKTFIILAVAAAFFALYLIGMQVINLYSKYIRCREMGLAHWKIICSLPFGFSLMWLPGYLLNDQKKNIPAVTISARWYAKFTNKILSNSMLTAIALILTTIYSFFFYGFDTIFITLMSTLIFTIWLRFSGLSRFRQHQGKTYAYFAIFANIVMLISFISFISMSATKNVTVNISETEVIQTNN